MYDVKEDALLASRRASLICKKGMFLNVERRLLASSSAFLRMERQVFDEISLQFLSVYLAFLWSLSISLQGCCGFCISQRNINFSTEREPAEELFKRKISQSLQLMSAKVLCDICRQKAFCRLFTCAKKLCFVCGIRER